LDIPLFDVGVVQSLDIVIPSNPLSGDMPCAQDQECDKDVKDARIYVDVPVLAFVLHVILVVDEESQ
jgi:hypothetical protein